MKNKENTDKKSESYFQKFINAFTSAFKSFFNLFTPKKNKQEITEPLLPEGNKEGIGTQSSRQSERKTYDISSISDSPYFSPFDTLGSDPLSRLNEKFDDLKNDFGGKIVESVFVNTLPGGIHPTIILLMLITLIIMS